MACPTCGFDADTVVPADAAVAARSFPRRFRGVLLRPDDEHDVVTRRPAPGQWSAVEHAAYAAVSLERAAEAVRTHHGDLEPGEPRAASVEAVLDHLDQAAEALARAIEHHGGEWKGVPLEAARHGVHMGAHHLRQAQRAVDAFPR